MAEVVLDLKIDAKQSVKTIAGLETEIESLTEELKGLEVGTKEFNKMARQIQGVSSEVKTLEKQFEGLEPQQVADSFVLAGEGIAGAFVAATGAAALFGESTEAVQEQMLKLQAAISIALGARAIAEGIVQGKIALTTTKEWLKVKAGKAQLVVQKAQNFAQKVFTGNLKGAVKQGKSFVSGLKNMKAGVLGAIVAVIAIGSALLAYISGLNAAKKAQKDFEQGIQDIKKAGDERVQALGRELRLLKAKGIEEVKQANLERDITKRKIEDTTALIKKNEDERAILEEIIGVKTKNGKLDKEAADAAAVSALWRGESIVKMQDARQALDLLNESEETSVKTTEALKKELFDLNTQLIENSISINDVEEGITDKQKAEQKKRSDDRKKAAEQRAKEIADAAKRLQDLQDKQIADQREKEIAQANTTFDRRLATIRGNSETETQLRIAIQTQRRLEIAKVNASFDEEEEQIRLEKIEDAKEQAEAARVQEETDRIAGIENRKTGLEAELIDLEIKGLITLEKKLEIAKAEQLALLEQDNLTKEQIALINAEFRAKEADLDKTAADNQIALEQRKRDAITGTAADTVKTLGDLNSLLTRDAQKQEKIQKALAIVQLGIDTAKSISSTIAGATAAAAAAGPGAPFVLGPYIATGLATVFASFVSAKNILGSSGSTPSVGGGASPSAPTAPPAFESIGGPVTQINTGELAVKAYVVESEMTDTQEKVKDFETQATFE